MEDPESLKVEIEKQNMLIKVLLENGANLDHEDKLGETAFITEARELYFKSNKKAMMEIVNHPNELGYTHEMFIDKRTQASVRTMYVKSGSKLVAIKNLIIWNLFLLLLTLIATSYNGSQYYDSFAFEEAIKETLVLEEFDPVEMKNLYDVANLDDWRLYLEQVYSKAVDTQTFYFRDPFEGLVEVNTSAMKGFARFVGAPRIRYVCLCEVVVSTFYIGNSGQRLTPAQVASLIRSLHPSLMR